MADSKESAHSKESALKELLKNKRTLKGTALYRYANRHAGYFALSLGCVHVALGAYMYNLDVDEFWIIGGREQISHKAVQYGIHDMNNDLPSDIVQRVKEEVKSGYGYSLYLNVFEYYYIMKEKFFSGTSLDTATESTGVSNVTSTLSSSPVDIKKD